MDESTGGGSGGAGSPARLTIVDSWLEPLPGAACGENLEYDEEFREMEKAAAGRPAGQFDPEDVPPDWRAVLGHTQSLFERTRDLRVAVYWTRARVRLEGVATLPEGLRLMQGLLARYWDELHPLPDDGDAYARVNALNEMSSLAGMLGDLRDSLVLDDRSVGELRGRDVEVALGVLEPRSGDTAYSRSTVEQMLRDGAQSKPELRDFPAQALAKVAELQQLMRDRVGYASAPEFEPLITTLTGIRDVMPGAADAAEGAERRRRRRSRGRGAAPRRRPVADRLDRIAQRRAARDRHGVRVPGAHRADQSGPASAASRTQAGQQELRRTGARAGARIPERGGPGDGDFR